jgi:hypothetical protein
VISTIPGTAFPARCCAQLHDAALKPREEVTMFVTAVGFLIAIGIGVLIAWSWVSFICEAIARRTGTANRVPFLDDILWARFGGDLLDMGLCGGAPALKTDVLRRVQQSQAAERRLPPRNADSRWSA